MTQVEGIPYRRHGPSAALRAFLDPLDPGDYFDCGRARLHGLDDALLEEARNRGRTPGDDSFQLVATDMGLIFCRPSISFAIAARWDEVTLIRPRGGDPVVLPVTWPRHGELKFTVSKRLAGNIFRRWLQLRMLAARRARRGHSDRFGRQELRRVADDRPLTGGHRVDLGVFDDSPPPDPTADVTGEAASLAVDPGGIALGGSATVEAPAEGEPPTAGAEAGGEDPTGFDPAGDDDRSGSVAGTDPDPAPTGPAGSRRALDDEDLERVAVPRPDPTPTSWVGSALSLAVAVVVLSGFVLVLAVSVGVYRRAVVAGDALAPAAPGPVAVDIGRTTIDHRRFSPTADRAASLDGEAPPGDSSRALTPIGSDSARSVAGGAAVTHDSSVQGRMTAELPPADEAVQCSGNYSGCVPDVDGEVEGDVDCPGQGDGPLFADGEVQVMGEDVYGLDTDGDGLACEADQPPAADGTGLP